MRLFEWFSTTVHFFAFHVMQTVFIWILEIWKLEAWKSELWFFFSIFAQKFKYFNFINFVFSSKNQTSYYLASFRQNSNYKSWAGENRKKLILPKFLLNFHFRDFSIKSCEEYLIYWTNFIKFKNQLLLANKKVRIWRTFDKNSASVKSKAIWDKISTKVKLI